MMRVMPTIVKLARPKPGTIRAFFASGEVREIEMWRYARKDTVFALLADRKLATKCRIVDDGDALRWPGGMDMSAGAIRRMGKRLEPESSPREYTRLVRGIVKPAVKPESTSPYKHWVPATASRSNARPATKTSVRPAERPTAPVCSSKRK